MSKPYTTKQPASNFVFLFPSSSCLDVFVEAPNQLKGRPLATGHWRNDLLHRSLCNPSHHRLHRTPAAPYHQGSLLLSHATPLSATTEFGRPVRLLSTLLDTLSSQLPGISLCCKTCCYNDTH